MKKKTGRRERLAAQTAQDGAHHSTIDLARRRRLLHAEGLSLEEELGALGRKTAAARQRLSDVAATIDGIGRVIEKR